MPIQSRSVLTNKYNGSQYDIELSYLFTDSTENKIKCRGNSIGDAEALLLNKESGVFSSKLKADIKYAVTNNLLDAYGEASQFDVWKEYITLGYSSFDPSESLFYMSKVAQNILDLGLTNEQLSSLFDSPIEEVDAILKKWDTLKLNLDSVNSYELLKVDM